MARKITGTVVYKNLGTGFWGIIDENGNEFRPLNMPEQIKYNNAKVNVQVEAAAEDVSIFMWGEAVNIVSFETMRP